MFDVASREYEAMFTSFLDSCLEADSLAIIVSERPDKAAGTEKNLS